MTGILYGVGVGPGDPELMTLKAVRLIQENNIIAVTGKTLENSTAYKIAFSAVPEIENRKLLHIHMPMVKDRDQIESAHIKAAHRISTYLDQGKNVVYLTLGDPTIYSSFGYIARILQDGGYPIEFVSGITSFCAVSARLKKPLVEENEPLHIIPAGYIGDIDYDSGACVFMKSVGQIDKGKLNKIDHNVSMVENCGMENERVYESIDDMPENAGYYTTVIVK